MKGINIALNLNQKKGFVRILESIVASIIILSSLSYFFVPATEDSGWDDTLLKLVSEDSLASLSKNEELNKTVMASDIESLNIVLKPLLPDTVDFSVVAKGVPKYEIRVGCVDCSVPEVQAVKSLLSPLEFTYKRRAIKIFEPKITGFPVDTSTDILFFMDYARLKANSNDAANFMKNGGKVFLLGNLQQADFSDGFLTGVFGLEWCPEPPDPDSCPGNPVKGDFYDYSDPSAASFRIANYYSNVSGVSLFDSKFGGENDFTFDNGNTINKITVNKNTVIEANGKKASFAKINELIGVRTAWVANFGSDAENLVRIGTLTRSIVMWLTSNEYALDPPYKRAPAGPVKIYEYFSVLSGVEPYEVNLKVWRVF